MADFRLAKKKQESQAVNPDVQLDPKQASGLLSTVGGAAMSGLHTVGSLLSTPSRALWGGLNAATGGEAGNMNPWDSTGGVELSRFLSDKGVIAANNPEEWELLPTVSGGKINPGDIGRGLIDIAGDPTSYIVPFGLTKAGLAAEKTAKLAPTMVERIGQGQQALMTIRPPLGSTAAHVGTGPVAAAAVEATKIPALAKKIKESAPIRNLRGSMDWAMGGKTHGDLQPHMADYHKRLKELNHEAKEQAIRHGVEIRESGLNPDEYHAGFIRHMEDVAGGADPLGHADESRKILESTLERNRYLGIGQGEELADPFGDKNLGYFPRSITEGGPEMAGNTFGSGKIIKSKNRSDVARQGVWKGFRGGREHVNELTREFTNGVRNPLYDIYDEAIKATDDEVANHTINRWKSEVSRLESLQNPNHRQIAKLEELRSLSPDEVIKRGFKHAQRDLVVDRLRQGIVEHFSHGPEGELAIMPRNLGYKEQRAIARAEEKHQKVTERVNRYRAEHNELAGMTDPSDIARFAMKKHNDYLDRLSEKDLSDVAEGAVARRERRIQKLEGMNVLTPKQQKMLNGYKKLIENHPDDWRDIVGNNAMVTHQKKLANALGKSEEDIVQYGLANHPKWVETANARLGRAANRDLPVAEHVLNKAQNAGKDRYKQVASKLYSMMDNPAIREKGLFGNAPVSDLLKYRLSNNQLVAGAETAYKALAGTKDFPDGIRLSDAVNELGFDKDAAVRAIADLGGDIHKKIDPALVEDLRSMTPSFKAPAAETALAKGFRNVMSFWKALTLAFPSSRVRDATSGAVQNILHRWVDPRFMVEDTRKLLSGQTVERSYEHVPAVQQWLAKSGKTWSPENQTKALQQIVANYLPAENNMLAEVVAGKHGSSIEHILHNMPGQSKKSLLQQGVLEPLKTLVGRGAKSESGEVPSWMGHEGPKGWIKQQARVQGVGDQSETLFAPVKASEQMSSTWDRANRTGPFMQMIHEGYDPAVAANKVNAAQVDYSPEKYTALDRKIRDFVFPFMSFNKGMMINTTKQLADPGSPTSMLTKALDKAHAGGDPSVPDYVMGGTGLPIYETPEGTKHFVTGFGLMHDPAVSMLGTGIGGLNPKHLGNFRPLMYDLAAQMGSHITMPAQYMTGQSFFQRGTPVENLDPSIGRTISNVGETLGLMPEGSNPVTYPGSRLADTLVSMTPYARELNALRTVTDPRKDIVSKALDTASGVKVTTIDKKKQLQTLRKRAKDLAKELGAFEVSDVVFSKDDLARLAETNPDLAQKQLELQSLIKTLKGRATKKDESKEFRLQKK